MFKRLLAPIDLSEPEMTKQGVDAALEFARLFDAQLHLLNVQTIMPVLMFDYVPAGFDERLRETIEQELAELAARIDFPKDRLSTQLRFGAVYPEVLAEAEDWGADLIVLCSHRPTMATYLIGSNAKTIVRHAKCSVLVVRR
jgi:nucleotide-binding universal stress UspA family protein